MMKWNVNWSFDKIVKRGATWGILPPCYDKLRHACTYEKNECELLLLNWGLEKAGSDDSVQDIRNSREMTQSHRHRHEENDKKNA